MQMRSAINVPAAARQRQQRGRRCVGVATMAAGTWAVGGFGQIELKCMNRTEQYIVQRGTGAWNWKRVVARQGREEVWFGGGTFKVETHSRAKKVVATSV